MYPKKVKNSINNSGDGNSNTRLIPQSSVGSVSVLGERETISGIELIVHLDALSVKGSLPAKKKFDELLEFICSITEQQMEFRISESPFYDGGNEYFSNRVQFTHGCVGGFNATDEEITYCIKLLGEYFENTSLINSWRLIRGLKNAFNCECTRLDSAIDDPTFEIIPINEMIEADRNGQRMFYKKYKNVTERNHLGKYYTTHYFGSRQSGKMVRVYNHDEECLRLETEFKRQYARKIFDTISSIEREENLEQELMKVLAGVAVGAIDFRDNSNRNDKQKASIKDTKRLDFWQKFIDLLGKELRVKLPKVIRTVAKVKGWISHQVSATLSALKQGMGVNKFNRYLDDVLFQGAKRISIRHELLIEVLKCDLSHLPNGIREARESGLIC